jgi:hypothetical protein
MRVFTGLLLILFFLKKSGRKIRKEEGMKVDRKNTRRKRSEGNFNKRN